MKVNGSATLDAPVERVWDALRDPAILVRTIPGCLRLETVGDDAYKMTVTAGVASIKGTYVGEVALTDPEPPNFVVLRARGQGAPGMIDATVQVRLSPAGPGVTKIDYDADATVGGMIGGVGQRMLVTVAKKTAGEFFAEVNRLLAVPTAPTLQPAGAAGVTATGVNGTHARTEKTGAAVAAAGTTTGGVGATGRPGGAGVYTAPAAATTTIGDARLIGAFAAGGAVALAGVLVGWLLGRRNRR